MKNSINYKRKLLIFFLVTVFFYGLSGFLYYPAQAGIASGSIINDPIHTVETLLQSIWDKYIANWEFWRDQVIDSIVARIINDFNEETVKWVQGVGDKKGPKYVTDWEDFVKQAGKTAEDQVIQDVGLARLCSPFSVPVNISLLPVQRFQDKISCTFNDIGQNLEDFYEDFRNGGWLGYSESWKPENNYFGQMIMIHDQLVMETAKKQEAASNEALASRGFLSVKKCVEQGPIDPIKRNEIFDSCFAGYNYDPDKASDCADKADKEAAICEKEEIITPGDVVAEAMGDVVRSDRERVYNSRSEKALYNLIANITNAAINRVVKDGIGYVKEQMSDDEKKQADQDYKDMIDRDNIRKKKEMITEINKLVTEWQYILGRKDRSPTNSSLSYSQQTLAALQEIQRRNKLASQSQPPSLLPSCNPPVSDSDIAQIQAEVNRLDAEVSDLETKIKEANDLITEINNVDLNNIRANSLVQDKYFQFTQKYSNDETISGMVTGSNRKAADSERNDKRTEFNGAQTRLNTCIQIQSMNSAP
ncbi:MAG: hypothetical protein AAB405_02260 [Patescibacteria group bacterium]